MRPAPAALLWALAALWLGLGGLLWSQDLRLTAGTAGLELNASGPLLEGSWAAGAARAWLGDRMLGWRLWVGLGAALLLAALGWALGPGRRPRPITALALWLALCLALDGQQLHFVLGLGAEGNAAPLELEHARWGLLGALLAAGLWCASAAWEARAKRAEMALPAPGTQNAAVAAQPTPRSKARLWLAAELLLAGLCSLGLGLWLGQHYLAGEPLTNDGRAYLFQARLFASGAISLPGGPWTDFFPARQIYAGERVFSKYPPGHSLVLALGLWLGAAKALVALGALLAPAGVWFLAKSLGAGRPRWAAWIFALSPMVLGIHGLWLAHGTSLPSGLAFLCAAQAALQRARQGRPALGLALLAGLALGLCFLARPGTALALSLPHLVALLLSAPRSFPRIAAATLLGAAPALAGYLYFNHATTGSAWLSPYQLYALERSPNDRWGLVNLASAWPNSAFNLGRLDRWMLGVAGGLLLLVWGFQRLPGRALAAGVPLALLIFYAFLRFHGVPWAGPVYLVEGLPALACLASEGLLLLSARGGRLWRWSWPLLALLFGARLLSTQFDHGRQEQAQRRAPALAAAVAPAQPALVFIPLKDEAARKRYHLAPPLGRPAWVLAQDLGERNRDLQRAFPDYQPYRWDALRGQLLPLTPQGASPR